MPVPSVITDLQTTASANYPQGTDSPSTLDDVQRAHGSFIAQLRTGAVATTANITAGTINGATVGATTPASGFFTGLQGQSLTLTDASSSIVGGASTGSVSLYNSTFASSVGVYGASHGSMPNQVRVRVAGTDVISATATNTYVNTNLIAGAGIDSSAIGATTPSTGKFTTLQATSGIDSTAIGATTPSTGKFTTLQATSGLNSTAVGNTTPSTGAFTTLSATGTISNAVAGSAYVTAENTSTSTKVTIGATGGSGNALYSQTSAGAASPLNVIIGASTVAAFSSTGLAVTGALSATGALTTAGLKEDASGNLGIGATSPIGSLDIRKASGSTSLVVGNSTTPANYGYLQWVDASTAFRIGTDGAFPIRFDTGGTEKMRIDTSGNVGLGVAPSAWNSSSKVLQIGGNGYVFLENYNASNLLLGSNWYRNTGGSTIYSTSAAAASYVQASGSHTWYTAPSGTAGTAITFTQSLAVGKGTSLALEGATSAAGTGIAFPATQLASSDANTLDDYEEGTFTPTIVGTTTAGAGTYTSQSGKYTKAGNVVTFTLDLAWTAHTGTGNLQINGLPFTSSGSSTYLSSYINNLSLTAGNWLQPFISTGTSINLYQVQQGVSVATIPMDAAAQISISGFYYV